MVEGFGVAVAGSDTGFDRDKGALGAAWEAAEKVDDVASVVKCSQRFVGTAYTQAHREYINKRDNTRAK